MQNIDLNEFNVQPDVLHQENDVINVYKHTKNGYKIAIPENYTGDVNQYPIYIHKNKYFSIKQFQNVDGRKHVTIYSYNKENDTLKKFIYYTSKSNGNFWRLCIHVEERSGGEEPKIKYEKGINYVTTTLINMKLQMWLFNVENNYENVYDGLIKDCPTMAYMRKENIQFRLIEQVYDETKLFIVLEKYFYSNLFEGLSQYKKMLKKFIKCIKFDEEIDLLKKLNFHDAIFVNDNLDDLKYVMDTYRDLYKAVLDYMYDNFQIVMNIKKNDRSIMINTGNKKNDINFKLYFAKIRHKKTGKD